MPVNVTEQNARHFPADKAKRIKHAGKAEQISRNEKRKVKKKIRNVSETPLIL